ncbi:MAG: hypothetical protein GY780_04885 [bacterium]|nr:hypothetical protein [bacterium]
MTRRRHWFAWAVMVYAAIIAVVWFGLVSLYSASRDRLDQALGERLSAVATTLAPKIEGRMVSGASMGLANHTAELELLSLDFQLLREDQRLSEICLTSALGKVLVSGSPSLVAGSANDFISLYRTELDLALVGQTTITDLYDQAGTLQKSALVPIWDVDPEFDTREVVAVLIVSGNADFFDSLAQLKKGALVTGFIVFVALVLMGVFLYRINLSFTRYQESIQRQENLASMGRMTAGIAHEIRNPLGIIRGAGEHLQRVLTEAGIEDPIADFIPEEVDRLNHILSGYLAFGSDKKTNHEPISLDQCLRRGAGLLKQEMEQANISIVLPAHVQQSNVMGDSLRFQQVLLNLFLNARDAMPNGGNITISLESRSGQALVFISDEGCGLAGIDRDKLFEPFWTQKEKGSGLGLAMSRKIVDDMDGTIELSDRNDAAGAVVKISLPLID